MHDRVRVRRWSDRQPFPFTRTLTRTRTGTGTGTGTPIYVLRISKSLPIPIGPKRIKHLQMLIRSSKMGSRRERSKFVTFYADIVSETFGWVVCGFICEWVVWGCCFCCCCCCFCCGGGVGGAGRGGGGGGGGVMVVMVVTCIFRVNIHIRRIVTCA